MSDHKIKVDVELDTSKAKKQLDDLTKQKQKVKIDVDASKVKSSIQRKLRILEKIITRKSSWMSIRQNWILL